MGILDHVKHLTDSPDSTDTASSTPPNSQEHSQENVPSRGMCILSNEKLQRPLRNVCIEFAKRYVLSVLLCMYVSDFMYMCVHLYLVMLVYVRL